MRNRYCFPVSGTFANLSRFRGGWSIDGIGVGRHFRGNGFGSRLLKRLCEEADLNGETLWLIVCPDDDSPLQWQALRRWYARYGFDKHGSGYYRREPICGHNMRSLRSDPSKAAVFDHGFEFV